MKAAQFVSLNFSNCCSGNSLKRHVSFLRVSVDCQDSNKWAYVLNVILSVSSVRSRLKWMLGLFSQEDEEVGGVCDPLLGTITFLPLIWLSKCHIFDQFSFFRMSQVCFSFMFVERQHVFSVSLQCCSGAWRSGCTLYLWPRPAKEKRPL